jgi:hypothetical protein
VKELIGRTTEVDVIDRANFRSQQLCAQRRRALPEFDARTERLLLEDAVDIFVKIQGEGRGPKSRAEYFRRHGQIIKFFGRGRYVATITP